MHIGVPREIKTQEYRVGLIPASVRELTHHGHTVTVETGAGAGVNFTDDDYRAAGADNRRAGVPAVCGIHGTIPAAGRWRTSFHWRGRTSSNRPTR